MERNQSLRGIFVAAAILVGAANVAAQATRTITADVVALDQAFYNNRLGTFQAGGMVFALRGDVVSNDGSPGLTAGNVMLRPDKRPRPIVLRMNVGDCLNIKFENLLAKVPSTGQGIPVPAAFPGAPFNPGSIKTGDDTSQSPLSQPATRQAGIHVMGMELKELQGDGSWVGTNPDSLANPGDPARTYSFCSVEEGAYLLYSTGADVGLGNGFGGQLSQGLFGSVTVQPKGAEWYRSQVTREDLDLATYRANVLASNMHLAPKMTGSTQDSFTSGGKTYLLWELTTGSGPAAIKTEVTQVDRAGDPVPQNGFLKTRDFHPIVDYGATYPANSVYPGGSIPIPAGTPILAMLNSKHEIVHSDLTAIITGPNAGRFPKADADPVFLPNPTYPDRDEPYREFAIHYHDDFVAVQAFPEFNSGVAPVSYALEAARDFFAINYGMDAIGAEVWANRINVGPMYQCDTCKFEEFFLSAWAVGDPAMVVDYPANAVDANRVVVPGPKATKALYPDDPSNVYHSYMGDHVEFRILHAGTNITHVHHQHAHQWLHSPDSDESDYRDSQMISPGGAYTLDMSYFGSGNLNQTVGDSIFHCHFYPHFAQGMWSMWRVHDVFEEGTKLDADQRPVLDWNRSLPDGEIATGTPIPALVPLPTLTMAPMPVRTRVCPVWGVSDYIEFIGDSCPAKPAGSPPAAGYKALVSKTDLDNPNLKEKNPGYPFFVPGIAGQRAPHPPLDMAPDEDAKGDQIVIAGQKQYLDGGLPRNMVLREQGKIYEQHNAWDFTKENDSLLSVQIDEEGTSVEKVAMAAHAVREHPGLTPEGAKGNFILNGQSPKPGAPFADPAVDIFGKAIPDSDCSKHEAGCVRYKAADIQTDVVLNKKGWHFPQQRMISLWGDVKSTLDGLRRPEPLFFRANSEKVVEYWLANLVPNYYELDDFQVRTPTDIIGQHIHLVKFDVTSSDGAGNGFNYEDGTYSPEEVVELIHQIDKNGGLYSTDASHRNNLTPKEIPYFAKEFPGKWPGAQATIQRWYADPIYDCKKPLAPGKSPLPCAVDQDRTLRTVFTHDHFGPSTHQQVGLYAGLVIEPTGSKWFDSTDGVELGKRFDGGPTTYQANIVLPDAQKSYREFLLEFQDRQLGYLNTSISTPKPYERYGPGQAKPNPGGFWGWADPNNAINPPNGPTGACPAPPAPCGTVAGGPPTPHLVTNQFQEGAYSLNYSNEPLVPRLATGTKPEQSDLGYVFQSMVRADPALNIQPPAGSPINSANPGGFKFAPPFHGAAATDPYTPVLRAYEGDNIQIRNLVGAHMGPHAFHIHGLDWQFEPSLSSSGFRSTQGMGLSEHYELLFHLPVTKTPADYLYISTSDSVGIQYGNWGLIRGYDPEKKEANLVPLESSQAKAAFPGGAKVPPAGAAPATCKPGAPNRTFDVTAVFARDVLDGALVYNDRGSPGTPGKSQIADWNALIYVLDNDLDADGKLKADVPREPLVLRAAAGDCITVELKNALPPRPLNVGVAAQPPFASFQLETSLEVGLHPQLVSYDVTTSDGFNIGANPVETISPGGSATYTWYAGKVGKSATGTPEYTPMEFGAISLAPADPLMQHNFGLVGGLIIEPEGFKFEADENSRLSGTVTAGTTSFRESVVVIQDDLAALRTSDSTHLLPGGQIPPTEAAPGGFSRALNYRTEPLPYRYLSPDYLSNSSTLSPTGVARALSNSLVSADPQTPVFPAEAGKPLRLRMLHPAGLSEQVFELHGHAWQEEPYSTGSTKIVADNPTSQWTGSRDTFGPNASFDVVLKHAGGVNAVQGDYLFRTFIGTEFLNGMWGLVRVGPVGKDVITLTEFCAPLATTPFTITGVNTVNPSTHKMAATVTITGAGLNIPPVAVDKMTGRWQFQSPSITTAPASITITSTQGGTTSATAQSCPIIQNATVPPAPLTQLRNAPKAERDDRFKPDPAVEAPAKK